MRARRRFKAVILDPWNSNIPCTWRRCCRKILGKKFYVRRFINFKSWIGVILSPRYHPRDRLTSSFIALAYSCFASTMMRAKHFNRTFSKLSCNCRCLESRAELGKMWFDENLTPNIICIYVYVNIDCGIIRMRPPPDETIDWIFYQPESWDSRDLISICWMLWRNVVSTACASVWFHRIHFHIIKIQLRSAFYDSIGIWCEIMESGFSC